MKSRSYVRVTMLGDSGYGLGLVELMAHCWGHRGGQRGRVVWFMLEWKTNR